MCHPIPFVRAVQQAIPNGCAAKALEPSQRLTIGVQALAGGQNISDLADQFDVSRKFVYQQATTARTALNEAFAAPEVAEEKVLFHLPVTKAWLRQVVLGLTLVCHSSMRGSFEFCRDLLDAKMSIGTIHNILRDAAAKAQAHNVRPALDKVTIAALDEIFQTGHPVLVGADVASTYCFLLSLEDHRDGETWGIRLLELQERGFAPQATIADFGTAIRSGLQHAGLGHNQRGDIFHALQELTELVTYVDNRAYDAIAARDNLERKKARTMRRGRSASAIGRQVYQATLAETKAIRLADDIAILAHWLHYEVFAVSGLPYADRCYLYDFIVAELRAREPLCPRLIKRVGTLLKNQRSGLLAFAAQLELDLTALAKECQVPVDVLCQLLDMHNFDPRHPQRGQREAALRQKLRHRFHALSSAVHDLAARTVRASSVIENLNSRLRSYFFLRRSLGPEYLTLLQFFLNHRRFLRSEHPERLNKSPAELLTGETHPHWLEMLGYTRFSRN